MSNVQQITSQGELLHAVSNVIELQPSKRYLLIFKGDTEIEEIEHMLTMLAGLGILSIGIGIRRGQEVEIIALPDETKGGDR